MKFHRNFLLAALAVLISSGQVNASLLGVDLSGNSWTTINNDSWTLGYRFSVGQSVTVDGLGFWDYNNSYNDTTVGLWRTDGTLIASVNSGSSAVNTFATGNGLGYWNFMGTNIALTAGEYVVGSWGDGMEYAYTNTGGAITTQVLTFLNAREQSGGIFQFPGDEINYNPAIEGFFGGNISFADNGAIPEPTTFLVWSMLGLTTSSLLRRKRNL